MQALLRMTGARSPEWVVHTVYTLPCSPMSAKWPDQIEHLMKHSKCLNILCLLREMEVVALKAIKQNYCEHCCTRFCVCVFISAKIVILLI